MIKVPSGAFFIIKSSVYIYLLTLQNIYYTYSICFMIIKALIYFLLSTVKFALTVPLIVYSFDFYESILISILGGISGVLFFNFVWGYIINFWNIKIIKKSKKTPKPVKFNRKKRFVINLKDNYGYRGVIITTAPILSIPFGTFILTRYFKFKKYRILHLIISFVIWGFIFIGFFEFF